MTESKIFRYKFAHDVVEELHRFARIHRDDDRHQFKDAWKVWMEENAELVRAESTRLVSLNYTGDVVDKMFKSVRYYFRKKSTEKKEPTQRRDYVSVSKDMIQSVDRHIYGNMESDTYTPANGYDDFCQTHKDVLVECVTSLAQNGFCVKEIQDKIKKTYKNRYYVLRKDKS